MRFKSILMTSALLGMVGSWSVVAASAADCATGAGLKTVVAGKLTVAALDYPPYVTPGKDGTLGGVEGDILTPFAEKNCLKVDAIVVDAGSAIQYVTTGKADLSSGQWYRTAARTKVVDISDPLYLDQLGIYSKEGYTKISQIEGKQVGTVQGYNWVGDLQKILKGNLKLYPNAVALAQDLAAGRVEVGIDSYGAGAYAQKQGGYAGFQIKVGEPDERVRASVDSAQVGFLVSKNDPELSKALNAYIADLQKSGGIADILKKNGLDPSGAQVGQSRLIQ